MNKRSFQLAGVAIIAALLLLPNAAHARRPKKPKFVGSFKCDGSCHDPWYQAWMSTGHAKAYSLLKAGVRPDAKKKAGLDPDKDYQEEPACLRCHTTGYQQRKGFTVDKHKDEDPEEPNMAAVGCEMCHTVMGGSAVRVIMKNEKSEFKRTTVEKYGMRYDYENVCKRCHLHENSPFQPSVDSKYSFNFEERVKKVHDAEKFRTELNLEHRITKRGRVSIHEKVGPSVSAKTPHPIETWSVEGGEFKKSGKWGTWDKNEKKVIWEDEKQ